MTDFADAEPRKGREALSDARTPREADGSTAGVVDRVYFAAFHAVRTVLSVRGSLPDDEDTSPLSSPRTSSSPRKRRWRTPGSSYCRL